MTDTTLRRRIALVALTVGALTVACGGESTDRSSAGATDAVEATAAPLAGLSFDVHRDPG